MTPRKLPLKQLLPELSESQRKLLLRAILERLPEKRYHIEGSGGTGSIETKIWKISNQPDELAFNHAIHQATTNITQLLLGETGK